MEGLVETGLANCSLYTGIKLCEESNRHSRRISFQWTAPSLVGTGPSVLIPGLGVPRASGGEVLPLCTLRSRKQSEQLYEWCVYVEFL